MTVRKQLERAAEHGLLRSEQVGPLCRFLEGGAQNPDNEPAVSADEPLRFIRNFSDVFIFIGIVLVSAGLAKMDLLGVESLIPAASFALLAEWLVRVRRLALPGAALLLAMLAFIGNSFSAFGLSSLQQAMLIALASGLFYQRYRLSFSLLPLAIALVVSSLLLAEIPLEQFTRWFGLASFPVFAMAMFYDIRDPMRCSYLSDNAFWLHLLAAPLMVHGAMVTLLVEGDAAWIQAIGREYLMIAFFIAFLLLALLLNRRALLIFSNLYVIYAVTRWNATNDIIMYLVFALGMTVIFFGAYWHRVRRQVWGWLGGYSLARHLSPFELTDGRVSDIRISKNPRKPSPNRAGIHWRQAPD